MSDDKFNSGIFKSRFLQNTISRNGAILGSFALATTLLISITHWLTSPVIEQQRQHKTLSLITEVLPDEYWDNNITNNCTIVNHPDLGPGKHRIFRAWLNGKPSALVIESTTPNGYSGNIAFLVSLTHQERLAGVRVLEHKETPGLGDKIDLRISDWILTFSNRSFEDTQQSSWAVKKDGGKFDQFTGATITPRAVISGVKNAVTFAQAQYQALFDAVNDCAPIDGEQHD